jgi:hypothetical protein
MAKHISILPHPEEFLKEMGQRFLQQAGVGWDILASVGESNVVTSAAK